MRKCICDIVMLAERIGGSLKGENPGGLFLKGSPIRKRVGALMLYMKRDGNMIRRINTISLNEFRSGFRFRRNRT